MLASQSIHKDSTIAATVFFSLHPLTTSVYRYGVSQLPRGLNCLVIEENRHIRAWKGNRFIVKGSQNPFGVIFS